MVNIFLGISLVVFGVWYIMNEKAKVFEIIDQHGGNMRIIRRFVIFKTMQNGINGRLITKVCTDANIVQFLSIDGNNWIDHSWATAQ